MLIRNDVYQDFLITIVDKSFDGILAIELLHKITEFTITIICVYLPPENSNYGRDASSFYSHLITLVYDAVNSDVTLICGDFNARIGERCDYIEDVDELPPRIVLDKVVNNHGELFIDFLRDIKMCVLNGRFQSTKDDFTCISTRGKSVVDYFAVPHECLRFCKDIFVNSVHSEIDRLKLHGLLSSKCKSPDHSFVTAHIVYSYETENTLPDKDGVNSDTIRKSKLYCFNNRPNAFLNSDMWKNAINSIIYTREMEIRSQIDVDDSYKAYCDVLLNEMDTHLDYVGSSKRVRKMFKSHKPFWNEELNIKWKEMRVKEKMYLKCKNANKSHYLSEFKMAQNLFERALRYFERKYVQEKAVNMEECNTQNPREFWKHIKSLGPKKKIQIPLKIHTENGFNTCIDDVLHKWKDDFQSLFNETDTSNYDKQFYDSIVQYVHDFENNISNTNDFVNEPISYDELEKCVLKLHNKKAVGMDGIPNEILKNKDVMLATWKLFTVYFTNGVVPSVWLKSVVVPIPKSSKKDPFTPLNYRGLSILSCVAKLYSSVLNTRITKYCDMMDIIVDEQNGFRSGRSCEDHIFSLTSIIHDRIENKKPVFCAFIDLEKAFDHIDRNLLLYRLIQYNIDGKMYKAVKSLYTNTFSCVKLNNELYTDIFSVQFGVKQGDNLSPTLFALYINELAKCIKNLNIGIKYGNLKIGTLLYADDMVFIAESEQDLQVMLNTMFEWCKKWRLKVNESKSQIVHFRKTRQKLTDVKFHYGDTQLQVVSDYKYLGVILDENLNFSKCSKMLAESGGRALSSIISKFKMFKDLGYKTFTTMYESGVVPILDYGSAIWGYSKNSHSDLIQNKASRYFLGLHNFTPVPALTGEMGWLPSKYRKMICMLRFWNRMIKIPNDRLTKSVFNTQYERNGKWCKHMNELFISLGCENVYKNRELCDLSVTKENIWNLCNDQWKILVQEKTKLRTYCQYKHSINAEDYVKCTFSRADRSILAKFRCGILQLHIETGRFNDTNLEDRVCSMCETNSIEDEFHFLCICPYY